MSGPLLNPEIIEQIEVPALSVPDLFCESAPANDIFEISKRKKWHHAETDEARCDFAPSRHAIHPKAGLWVMTIWKRSVKGRTLREIKDMREMRGYFARNLAEFIAAVLGKSLDKGDFAMVATPPRRHTEDNFAEAMADQAAGILGIPFCQRCAVARTRQRIGAVFTPNNIPVRRNVIVVDDIVTTGSTLAAMKEVLEKSGKNCIFFAGISNS